MKKKIESYQGAAGGWGAVKSVANAVRKQMIYARMLLPCLT